MIWDELSVLLRVFCTIHGGKIVLFHHGPHAETFQHHAAKRRLR